MQTHLKTMTGAIHHSYFYCICNNGYSNTNTNRVVPVESYTYSYSVCFYDIRYTYMCNNNK